MSSPGRQRQPNGYQTLIKLSNDKKIPYEQYLDWMKEGKEFPNKQKERINSTLLKPTQGESSSKDDINAIISLIAEPTTELTVLDILEILKIETRVVPELEVKNIIEKSANTISNAKGLFKTWPLKTSLENMAKKGKGITLSVIYNLIKTPNLIWTGNNATIDLIELVWLKAIDNLARNYNTRFTLYNEAKTAGFADGANDQDFQTCIRVIEKYLPDLSILIVNTDTIQAPDTRILTPSEASVRGYVKSISERQLVELGVPVEDIIARDLELKRRSTAPNVSKKILRMAREAAIQYETGLSELRQLREKDEGNTKETPIRCTVIEDTYRPQLNTLTRLPGANQRYLPSSCCAIISPDGELIGGSRFIDILANKDSYIAIVDEANNLLGFQTLF